MRARLSRWVAALATKVATTLILAVWASSAYAGIIYEYEWQFTGFYDNLELAPLDFVNPCQPVCTGIAHTTIILSDSYVFGTELTLDNASQYFESLNYTDGIELISINANFLDFISGAFDETGGSLNVIRGNAVQGFFFGERAWLENWSGGGYIAFIELLPTAVPEPNTLLLALTAALMIAVQKRWMSISTEH